MGPPKQSRWCEGCPDIVYIVFAWFAYAWAVYAYFVAVAHMCWQEGERQPKDDLFSQAVLQFAKIKEFFRTQDEKYMTKYKSWEGWEDQRLAIYCNNIAWMLLFMLQHTGMKKLFFKNSLLPLSKRLERPLYMLMAGITFQMVFTMACPLPTVIYEIDDWHVGCVVFLMTVAAYIGLIKATFALDHWSFMGITQGMGREPENLPFGREGMYGWVRHPQYFCQFVAFWSRARMTEGDLLFAVCMSLYILIAVRYSEEPSLIELIGPEYVLYTHEVPAYCPIKMIGCYLSQSGKKAKKKVSLMKKQ